MDSTGFREVIGSWKIIAISRPRIRRISSSESARRSRPLKRTRPPTMRPAGAAMRRMTESALTLLPQRSEEHTSELQSHHDLVCRLLLEKKKKKTNHTKKRQKKQTQEKHE